MTRLSEWRRALCRLAVLTQEPGVWFIQSHESSDISGVECFLNGTVQIGCVHVPSQVSSARRKLQSPQAGKDDLDEEAPMNADVHVVPRGAE